MQKQCRSSAEVAGSSAEVVGSGVVTRDWKSESVTYLRTDQLTGVGSRDTCVCKKWVKPVEHLRWHLIIIPPSIVFHYISLSSILVNMIKLFNKTT